MSTTYDEIVGIDLGTTGYSVVLHSRGIDSEPHHEPIHDFDGLDRTPCYVAHFVNGLSQTIGSDAKKIEKIDPESFVFYEPKRLIGLKFNDGKVQVFIPLVTYSVVDNGENNVAIVIERGTTYVDETPYTIYVSILKNIKRSIREYLKHSFPIQVAITVPSTFTENQRQATFYTALIVGFRVLQMVPETQAIAKTYFYEHEKLKKGDYFLVYDMGASDFKIAAFQATYNDFVVISNAEQTGVCGEGFDYIIVDYICDELKRRYGFNVQFEKHIIRQIVIRCEEARINLSEATSSTIVLQDMFADDVTVELSRTKFEEITKNLLDQTVDIVNDFINSINVNIKLIKKIILYGGLSRTPKILQLLFEHFGDKIGWELISENNSVAEGAALIAAQIS